MDGQTPQNGNSRAMHSFVRQKSPGPSPAEGLHGAYHTFSVIVFCVMSA